MGAGDEKLKEGNKVKQKEGLKVEGQTDHNYAETGPDSCESRI